MYTVLVGLSAAPAPGPKSLPDVISGLTGWIMGILALFATLFLVIGGLRYILSGGDPAQVLAAGGHGDGGEDSGGGSECATKHAITLAPNENDCQNRIRA